jgi:polar amino acid transport system substrate-binding protein
MTYSPRGSKVLALSSALAFVWSASACTTVAERSTWDRVQSTGIVRVGYAVEAPFVVIDSGGRVSGESPEVLRLVMSELGVDSIEWVATRFGSLIMELQRGEFDVIAAGMYVTPERSRSVLFSRPTLRDPTALLVRREDVTRGFSLADFAADRQLVLAVIAGAAEEPLALAAGLEPAQLRSIPDPATGRAAVLSGEAQAFALSTVSLTSLRRSRADSNALQVVPLLFPHDSALRQQALGQPAFAVRLDDVGLRDAINRALSKVLGTPAHRTIQQRFGIRDLFDTVAVYDARTPLNKR